MIKVYKNIKIVLLTVVFLASVYYAYTSYMGFIYKSEFPKSLTLKSLELDSTKIYFFTTNYKPSFSKDTIYLPIENKSFPDSLCYLYFENEWKLKLTEKLRKNDKDKVTNIFYPWCCSQDDDPIFYEGNSALKESILSGKGIKFNYFSGIGSDRLTINISKVGQKKYLKTNLAFLGISYPISNLKENIIELDFNNYGDTTTNKYVTSIPMFDNNLPARKFIKIDNEKISWKDSTIRINSENQKFSINSLQFELANNYSEKTKNILLLILLIIPLLSLYTIYRLYNLQSKLPHRNLQVIEQSNILILRVIFNCIILVGFPILILKIKFSPERLINYSILVLLLNVNWVWLFSSFGKSSVGTKIFNTIEKSTNRISKTAISTILLGIILLTIGLIWKTSNNEKLFGVFPILHITKFLYILLPFILVNKYVISIGQISFIKRLNVNFSYVLVGLLSLVIALVSSDYATFLFTMLAILFIQLLEKDRKEILPFLKKSLNSWGLWVFITFSALIIYFYKESIFSLSKVYRFTSTLKLPNDSLFVGVDEQSKQTVAQQLYLIKSTITESSFFPNFKTVILPSWKSTFFSDYAVLWSFKSGGYFFIFLYFLLLLFISYCIISLLIILNKKIPLHNGNMVSYDKRVLMPFNIILSIFLIQYIYTFLSNLWLLPVTGQSPGILCPSIFEFIFHIIFINSAYYFIDKKKTEKMPDKYPITYIKIRNRSVVVILGLFLISLILLFRQLYHIKSLENIMTWKVNTSNSISENLITENLEVEALKAYKENNKVLFKMLHQRYYNTENLASPNFTVSNSFIAKNTNIDSLTFFHKYLINEADSLAYYKKQLNLREVEFINNRLYSGCPISSTTINFNLQKQLNIALIKWANTINADSVNNHIMLGGSIIVAQNNNGNIISSASYPLLFNENNYHLKFVESNINNYSNFKFKYFTTEDYINFSEFDQMPGSIVKPLLAYGGLKILEPADLLIKGTTLNSFIGKSLPDYATVLFQRLSFSHLDSLKAIYTDDFAISQFYDLNTEKVRRLNSETLKSYAIGQQNKLIFKDIVQAYTRIKTGQKIKYKYFLNDSNSVKTISLNPEKLLILQQAMKFPLINSKGNTAKDVGIALTKNGINYKTFLAKTGTVQLEKDPNHNKTSSFIIVTDDYTIGIQLFGDLPKNESGNAARHLFITIIGELKGNNIF